MPNISNVPGEYRPPIDDTITAAGFAGVAIERLIERTPELKRLAEIANATPARPLVIAEIEKLRSELDAVTPGLIERWEKCKAKAARAKKAFDDANSESQRAYAEICNAHAIAKREIDIRETWLRSTAPDSIQQGLQVARALIEKERTCNSIRSGTAEVVVQHADGRRTRGRIPFTDAPAWNRRMEGINSAIQEIQQLKLAACDDWQAAIGKIIAAIPPEPGPEDELPVLAPGQRYEVVDGEGVVYLP